MLIVLTLLEGIPVNVILDLLGMDSSVTTLTSVPVVRMSAAPMLTVSILLALTHVPATLGMKAMERFVMMSMSVFSTTRMTVVQTQNVSTQMVDTSASALLDITAIVMIAKILMSV